MCSLRVDPVHIRVKRVCVLRSGKEYQPKHVQWLASQIPGLICLSDVLIDGVETIPLKHYWPGWFAKFELFRPDIEGDLLYFDIDTVITGDLTQLEVGQTTMLSDFYHPQHPASGLMYIAQSDKAKVWEYWNRDPAGHMRRAVTTQCWGDQGILREIMTDAVPRWPDSVAVSYKVHCKQGVPPGAAVVCFHGKPRPWQSGSDWVPPLK